MVLAAAPGGSLLTTRSIADAVGTPYNHVSKAMAKLRELGMIDVERGRAAVPGSAAPGAPPPWASSCGSWTPGWTWPPAWRNAGACPLITECRFRAALSRAREAFYRELDDVVVASLPTSSQMAPVFQAIGLRPGL